MSKNFELLQQVGNDGALLRRAYQLENGGASADVQANLELDEETVKRVLQKASLPDVFQITKEAESPSLGEPSEAILDLDAEGASSKLRDETAAGPFRAPRNPTDPIGSVAVHPAGELRKDAENGGMRSSVAGVSVGEPGHTGRRPEATRGAARQEQLTAPNRPVHRRSSQRLSLPFPWLDSLKSGAKAWRWKEQTRNNGAGADLKLITHEEEIKLVQRVFPGTTDQGSPRAVLFARLDGEAGCARTCARVAEILAARGEGPVCIVDANFGAPSLHEYFGVENLTGLAEATVETGPIQNFAQQIPEPDLWLMPSGKAAARLRFPAMADGLRVRMEELRSTFSYVVIHSGPLRMETSSMLLSRWTDGVVLIVEANATRKDTARRAKQILDAANINVLGIVLNNRRFPIPEAIYRRL